MKKIFTLIAVALCAMSVSAQTEWNFSDWTPVTISETTTINGLTVYAESAASIAIDASKKTIDGAVYTQRLKFGGTGAFDESGISPTSRVLEFNVPGDCAIYIAYAHASSSGDDRILNVCAGTEDNVVGTCTATPGATSSNTINYKGDATKIYVYSKNSGINIYDIKYMTSTGIDTVTTGNVDANAPLFSTAGTQVNDSYKGIVIQNNKKFIKK